MKTQQCTNQAQTQTKYISQKQKRAERKHEGQRIAQLEHKLKTLDTFENGLKNHMQDRLKFMSAKYAMQKNAELTKLHQQKDALRSEIKKLQGE